MAEEGACGRCRAVTVKHGATEGVCGGHQDHACAHGAACCGCWRWHDTVSSRTSPWASAVHPDAATASFLRRCPYLLPVEGDYGLKEQRFLFMYSSFFFYLYLFSLPFFCMGCVTSSLLSFQMTCFLMSKRDVFLEPGMNLV